MVAQLANAGLVRRSGFAAAPAVDAATAAKASAASRRPIACRLYPPSFYRACTERAPAASSLGRERRCEMLFTDYETHRQLVNERRDRFVREAQRDALRRSCAPGGFRAWMLGAVCVLLALLLPLAASANQGREVTIE